VTSERIADNQLLNRERMGDVTARKRIDDRLRDAEIGKGNYLKCSLFERLGRSCGP
jgi:hypothetical protein